jgi:hypothetical protein
MIAQVGQAGVTLAMEIRVRKKIELDKEVSHDADVELKILPELVQPFFILAKAGALRNRLLQYTRAPPLS